jgi:hypothetical protein
MTYAWSTFTLDQELIFTIDDWAVFLIDGVGIPPGESLAKQIYIPGSRIGQVVDFTPQKQVYIPGSQMGQVYLPPEG